MPLRVWVWSGAACLGITTLGLLGHVPLWVTTLCGAIAGWRVAVWSRKR